MNWRLKALILNAIARLPSSLSYAAHYELQRHLGGLRQVSPVSRLVAGIEICDRIERLSRSPLGSTFLEVGTGRGIDMPLAFWLLGAEKTLTVDLNPYLREELVQEDIDYIGENREEVEGLFDGRIHDHRLDKLLEFAKGGCPVVDLLEFCHIEYLAPADAANLPLPANSIDFHTSFTVLEHIPPDTLKAILQEGKRLIKSRGLFVHRIDYSDHFSHSDGNIPSINFLQFSDKAWDRIAGNRYMYVNRLRVDDFEGLYRDAGHRILLSEPDLDPRAYELLRSGSLKPCDRFSGKSDRVLATVASWIVSDRGGELGAAPDHESAAFHGGG